MHLKILCVSEVGWKADSSLRDDIKAAVSVAKLYDMPGEEYAIPWNQPGKRHVQVHAFFMRVPYDALEGCVSLGLFPNPGLFFFPLVSVFSFCCDVPVIALAENMYKECFEYRRTKSCKR